MARGRVWFFLSLVALAAPGAVVAQELRTPTGGAVGAVFPATSMAIEAALCSGHGHCAVDWVLPAGHRARDVALAVVRMRVGPAACREHGERAYRDYLVEMREGVVRRRRELAHGDTPCLEWQLSRWRYVRGELVFTYGGMGAPPSSDTDMRPITVHLRPWPLTVTAELHGDESVPPSVVIPPSGPIFRLEME